MVAERCRDSYFNLNLCREWTQIDPYLPSLKNHFRRRICLSGIMNESSFKKTIDRTRALRSQYATFTFKWRFINETKCVGNLSRTGCHVERIHSQPDKPPPPIEHPPPPRPTVSAETSRICINFLLHKQVAFRMAGQKNILYLLSMNETKMSAYLCDISEKGRWDTVRRKVKCSPCETLPREVIAFRDLSIN